MNLRIYKTPKSTSTRTLGGPISTSSIDPDAARDVVTRYGNARLRDLSTPDLHAAIGELTRAGVRLEGQRVMAGQALLGQMQEEAERRVVRAAQQAPRLTGGPYSDRWTEVRNDHKPRPNSFYA